MVVVEGAVAAAAEEDRAAEGSLLSAECRLAEPETLMSPAVSAQGQDRNGHTPGNVIASDSMRRVRA